MRSSQTVNELIAGSAGGAAQVLVGQPLDTIKTRAQIAPSSVSFFRSVIVYHLWLMFRIYLSIRGNVCERVFFRVGIFLAPRTLAY